MRTIAFTTIIIGRVEGEHTRNRADNVSVEVCKYVATPSSNRLVPVREAVVAGIMVAATEIFIALAEILTAIIVA